MLYINTIAGDPRAARFYHRGEQLALAGQNRINSSAALFKGPNRAADVGDVVAGGGYDNFFRNTVVPSYSTPAQVTQATQAVQPRVFQQAMMSKYTPYTSPLAHMYGTVGNAPNFFPEKSAIMSNMRADVAMSYPLGKPRPLPLSPIGWNVGYSGRV